ncbi:histidinol-phosphate aminotransferase [Clostridia bacterium]|nr:histidinol-phosphate aminotransferase [Clostridia bacterium]
MNPSMYLSPLARTLTPYVAGEQPQGGGWIKLNTNESPLPPSPKVMQAIRDEMGADGAALRLYPDPDADALRASIARRHGVQPENVFVSNGSDEALAFTFAAFFAGVDCVSPAVGYSFYPTYAKLFGAPLRLIPMGGNMSVDVDALLNADAPIILANPNAPTTLALSRETILTIRERLDKRGQLLVVDEAYAPFAEECAVANDCASFDNLLVIRTFSKAHALAGMRVGYAVGHASLIDGLRRARDSFNSYPVDRLAQAAALAAVEDAETLLYTVGTVNMVKSTARKSLLALGFECVPSRTNFLFTRHPAISGKVLFDELKARRILVRRFDKPSIADYLRITVGTPDEMATLASNLEQIVAKALQR